MGKVRPSDRCYVPQLAKGPSARVSSVFPTSTQSHHSDIMLHGSPLRQMFQSDRSFSFYLMVLNNINTSGRLCY